MLIGGFYNVDIDLLQKEVHNPTFELRLDTKMEYTNKVYTNNGRTATIHAFEQSLTVGSDKVILLPDYLCLSVITSVEYPGIKYRFYKVKRNLEIDISNLEEKIQDDVAVIYVIHYFGVPQPAHIVEKIKKISADKSIAIIEDITQALFSRDEERMGFGDYIVGSTRKWMPMTDGGILAVRDNVPLNNVVLENAYNEATYRQLLISLMRDYYNQHPNANKDYYLTLEKEANDSRYTDLKVRAMTEVSKRVFFNCDKADIVKKRRMNYSYLYERLNRNKNITLVRGELDTKGDYVPFGFVILIEKRDEMYKYLFEHNIVAEIQWVLPVEYYDPGEDAKYLSSHNIMIHCDQRYGQEDMEFIADTIEDFFKCL